MHSRSADRAFVRNGEAVVAPHFAFAVPRPFCVRISDALAFYGGIMLH